MTVRYVADLEQLESHVERVGAFAGQVVEVLAHLDQVVAVLHLTWEGQAAAAHQRAHGQWVRGVRELTETLTHLEGAVRRAHGDYHAAAAANHEMWSSLA